MPFSRLLWTVAAASLALAPFAALGQSNSPVLPPASTVQPSPVAPNPASPNLVANGNIITTLQGSGHFTILLKALDATNLTGTLKATPNLTLFAPTDAAFQALPAGELYQLMMAKNAPILQKVLVYHLVHLDLDSSKIKGAKGPVESVETAKLVVDGSGPVLKVNDADIIQADVHASNGLIQVVNKVLIPPDVSLPTGSAQATPPASAAPTSLGG